MKRWTVNILAALSFLMLAAVAALWARSYGDSDHWVWRRIDTDATLIRELYVHSWKGHFRVSDLTTPFTRDFYDSPHHMAQLKGTAGLWHAGEPPGIGDLTRRQIARVPHWVFLPPLAVLPLIAARREWTRRHRLRLGLCGRCGYDLRASPERCPECGAAAPKPNLSTQAP